MRRFLTILLFVFVASSSSLVSAKDNSWKKAVEKNILTVYPFTKGPACTADAPSVLTLVKSGVVANYNGAPGGFMIPHTDFSEAGQRLGAERANAELPAGTKVCLQGLSIKDNTIVLLVQTAELQKFSLNGTSGAEVMLSGLVVRFEEPVQSMSEEKLMGTLVKFLAVSATSLPQGQKVALR